MPLTGTLRDLSLANLVQLQCSEQHNAQVHLTKGTSQGMLVFADGEIVHARVDQLEGEPAVYELLTWEDGSFQVTSENLSLARNVQTPWSMLLLEGLRLADEHRAERDAVLESDLRALRGKQGLRNALAVNTSGSLRANAKEQNAAQDAAFIAFIANRAEVIGSVLELGMFSGMTASNPKEKIILEKIDSNFLAFWLEPRATPDQIKAILMAVGIVR
ncbi:MAG: DUF4388 domain-containing protein [Chloroflexi bacterium]|nr:DUF4388 domain-containing protein [Chloroflexota bacterium]